jgi:hypothetical protein
MLSTSWILHIYDEEGHHLAVVGYKVCFLPALAADAEEENRNDAVKNTPIKASSQEV